MGLIDFSLGDIGSLFKDIREAITGKAIEDPNKRAEIELKLQQLENAINEGQIEINKAEAQNTNWYVAGWRPTVGYIGAFAIAYAFMISPVIEWYCKFKGLHITPPVIDSSQLFNLVLAMLGSGGFRTFEKLKKVQNLH